MFCANCREPRNHELNYCPHCGMAAKPPTEAENRDMGDIRDTKSLAILVAMMMAVIFIPTCIIVYMYHTSPQRFFLAFFALSIIMAISIFWKVCIKWFARNLPLIKRSAVVHEKRRIKISHRPYYFISFLFPDGEKLKFSISPSAYSEVAEGDHIIVKYKIITQKSVYYGYERISSV